MIEIEAEERKKVRCFLIYDYGTCGNELQGLTDTLNMETVGSLTLPKKTESQSIARFGIGTGK
ncbi:MAG: GTPase HflX, partial [Spirochaetaceae bacterium]|nr:GTPase HflX [Spirochaetaceae bacterium]